MERTVTSWFSPCLNKEMEVVMYGHYGFALLLIPTASSNFLEYEDQGLIRSIEKQIDEGKVKVYCINSINGESWLNPYMSPVEQGVRHQAYCDYVYQEVVPYIRTTTSPTNLIITAGAGFGALHAANLYFKFPDIFGGVIGLSGCYDLSHYTKGYFDDNVYFNSPKHYLSNLKVESHLNLYRSSRHIHLVSGSGAQEHPQYSKELSEVLQTKMVGHELDIWGKEFDHNWGAWQRMLGHYLNTRF
ncbi:esterase/lipase superfamily enzyme [Dyadobacter jejuensis]|uniref:Esterase/lipase superfamily enzyme n=1 Tax=Dyadobacter jejuensis TaxID=1082580 RepID=A0A316ASZ2_9BACT|nr:alpha/beta hydrolase-fold protein [Dyadobacter jejuensis]PWJ60638.1 esterase/lipase superfamily enzyme [Dyadobacter jejuensis]